MMSTSDNHSRKHEKKDPSAMKKQSEMENEEKEESGNVTPENIDTRLKDLNIKESPSINQSTTSDRKNIRVKFLINVPMEIKPEMAKDAESYCKTFLDLLKSTAFKEEDELRYEDIAVVFGLNGKESDEFAVDTEFQSIQSKIRFEKFWFTWTENKGIPYRTIRENIKNHTHTKEFVKYFRDKDPKDRIYFCFFDADIVHFNHVLSSYIDVIKEHNYPTVMSTGYVFPKDSNLIKKSEHDLKVRIKTAEHFPLGTYYPEPNFCVLLPDGCDTLCERFDFPRDGNNNMESPILITQVKQREAFSAVFAKNNPVITCVSKNNQFHTNKRTWALSAYAHRELKVTENYKKERFKKEYFDDKRRANRVYVSLLLGLLDSDVVAQETEDDKPFEGPGADQVFKAAKAVREYLKDIESKTSREGSCSPPTALTKSTTGND